MSDTRVRSKLFSAFTATTVALALGGCIYSSEKVTEKQVPPAPPRLP